MDEQQTPQTRRTDRREAARRNQQKRRTTHGLILGAMLLGVAVLLSAATLLHPNRSYSENENRMLAQSPTLSLDTLADGSFFTQAEDHFADQFAGRDFWMSANLARERFFGTKESGGVYLCRDNYLIQAPAAPNETALARNLEAIRDFAARHGALRVCMTTVPNAACILQDKLPTGAPVRDQRSDIAAVAEAVEGVQFVDLTDTLAAHADEYLYYRTDHHWTSLAACYAFDAMAPALGLTQTINDYAVYTVSTRFEGTLASKSGLHGARDTITVYIPQTDVEYNVTYRDAQTTVSSIYSRASLDTKDQYTVFFGGNHPRVDIHTTSESGRCLLLFKDSYANCFVQFLTPYYEKILLIDPRYYYESVENLIAQEGVTDVLFFYNIDTFQGDTALADVLESSS